MRKVISIIFVSVLVACGSNKVNKDTKNDVNGGSDSTASKTEVLDNARPSPLKRVTGKIGDVKVVVQWGSPSVKGREIWNVIVPYDEVWRSGANEATSVELDKDVTINGQELKAGKYGFFTIPRQGEWTVIFNSAWNIWGAFDYDEKKDVLRFNTTPVANTFSETLEYSIESDGIALSWEKIKIKVPVKAK